MGRKHSNFSDGRCNGGSTVFDIDEIRKICRKESIKWRKRKKINVTYEDVDLTVKELVQELTKKQIPVPKYHVKQPLLTKKEHENKLLCDQNIFAYCNYYLLCVH